MNSNEAVKTNRFYTIELQATIPPDGPIDFEVLAASIYGPPLKVKILNYALMLAPIQENSFTMTSCLMNQSA